MGWATRSQRGSSEAIVLRWTLSSRSDVAPTLNGVHIGAVRTLVRVALLLSLLAAAASCSGHAVHDPESPQESVLLALGQGEVVISSPAPFAKFSEGDDVTLAVSVGGVTVGPSDYGLRYYLDGAAIADREDSAPFTVASIAAGQHHLAVRLLGPDGAELDHDGALTGRYIRATRGCEIDEDCDDGLACSSQGCVAGGCRYGSAATGCCDHDLECGPRGSCSDGTCVDCLGVADCDDGDPCTVDVCSPGGTCLHDAVAECCAVDTDCGDDDLCTIDRCVAGTCQHDNSADPLCCNSHDDCAPEDPCLAFVCYVRTVGVSEPTGSCRFGPPGPGCCDADSDCDDGSPCTVDACDLPPGEASGSCTFTPTGDGCCQYHADCDDADEATQDRCIANSCVHATPPGYCALPPTSAVVINEFQAAPVPGASRGDWVELLNTTAADVIDLDGWRLVIDGQAHVLHASQVVSAAPNARKLFPGRFFSIAAGPSANNGGFLPHYIEPALELPEDGGSHVIELEDATGALVDRVSYDATWPWEAGRSFELRHPHLDNDSAASWRVAGTHAKRSLNRRYGDPRLDQWGSPRTPNYSSRGGVPSDTCQAALADGAPACLVGVCGWNARCESVMGEGCCEVDADCDDGDACTADSCVTGACAPPQALAGCCLTVADCDDGNPCNVDRCVAHECRHSPDVAGRCCDTRADCDDGDPCSYDVCVDGLCGATKDDPCDGEDNDCDGRVDEDHGCGDHMACVAATCVPACGDGIVLPGEACDDGNAQGGDGCAADCTVEAGWTCLPQRFRTGVDATNGTVPAGAEVPGWTMSDSLDGAEAPAIAGGCPSFALPASGISIGTCAESGEYVGWRKFFHWRVSLPDQAAVDAVTLRFEVWNDNGLEQVFVNDVATGFSRPSAYSLAAAGTFEIPNERLEVGENRITFQLRNANGTPGFNPGWLLVDGPDVVSVCHPPATSCQELLALDPTLPSGSYWIDVDGAGPEPKRLVTCDMCGGLTFLDGATVPGHPDEILRACPAGFEPFRVSSATRAERLEAYVRAASDEGRWYYANAFAGPDADSCPQLADEIGWLDASRTWHDAGLDETALEALFMSANCNLPTGHDPVPLRDDLGFASVPPTGASWPVLLISPDEAAVDGTVVCEPQGEIVVTPGCSGGRPCETDGECLSGSCEAGLCAYSPGFPNAAPVTCATLRGAGHSTSGVYRVDPDGPGGALPHLAYCHMDTLGGGWTRLMVHRAADGYFGDLDSARYNALDDPLDGLHSRLGDIDAFADVNGRYEILYWNRTYDRWVASEQTSSPTDASLYRQCAEGWRILASNYSPDYFCGYTPGPPSWALLTGYGPNWTHAAGQLRDYASWPLVCTHNSGYRCDHVELFIRERCAGDCPDGSACTDGSTCLSGYCDPDGECAVESCSDGFRNLDETDLDCGGTSCLGCLGGQRCAAGADCWSGACVAGVCTQPAHLDGSPVTCATLRADGVTSSGLQVVDPDGAGGDPPMAVRCEMEHLGGGWTMLLNHDASGGAFFGTLGAARSSNAWDPRSPLFSRLGDVDRWATTDGRWELMYWNRQHDTWVAVAQTSSPLDPAFQGKCAANWRLLASNYAASSFCGFSYGPERWTLINGYGPNWWQAAGQLKAYQAWPLVCTHGSGGQCDHVQFYVRERCAGQCLDGSACAGDGDCLSAYCRPDGVCGQPSCGDGWKNGGEADVDCGGSCSPCLGASPCTSGGDCWTGQCVGGQCTVPFELAGDDPVTCATLRRAGYTESRLYPVDPDGAGGSAPYLVRCEMQLSGGGWTLLMNHEASGGLFFGDLERAQYAHVTDPDDPTYSRLGDIARFEADDARYEVLYWNRQHDRWLVSRQGSYPLELDKRGQCADDWTIEDGNYVPGLFCGYTPGPASWALLTGYGPNWTHAAGQLRDYAGWPLVCGHNSGYHCDHVQLYMRELCTTGCTEGRACDAGEQCATGVCHQGECATPP